MKQPPFFLEPTHINFKQPKGKKRSLSSKTTTNNKKASKQTCF